MVGTMRRVRLCMALGLDPNYDRADLCFFYPPALGMFAPLGVLPPWLATSTNPLSYLLEQTVLKRRYTHSALASTRRAPKEARL